MTRLRDWPATPARDLTNWASDDLSLALIAFSASASAPPVRLPTRRHRRVHRALRHIAPVAKRLIRAAPGDDRRARRFFECLFRPVRYHRAEQSQGLLTGYFEPELAGSLEPSPGCNAPVYARPPDLVDSIDPVYRATEVSTPGQHAYLTRREIDAGALAGRGLEIAYVTDSIALYFMHVQGSGRIRLNDGRVLRVGFDGKNGRPYTSIAKVLVERGELVRDAVSLPVLDAWLRADLVRARALMQENQSYIFFKINSDLAADAGPRGAMGVSLTAGRSLAVDASIYPLGLPIYVSSASLDCHGEHGFYRMMIAQDVGSAIKGFERGDIYWGSGAKAGQLAGTTKHRGSFTVFLPRAIRRL